MSKRDFRQVRRAEKCGPTRKRRFKSHSAAMQFVTDLGSECKAEQMRAYQCPLCAGFHLTSQDKGFWRARDSR
jgi:hypothetical protein